VTALDSVDIALYPGEVHAVLGENGAGKSTLVGILSGNIAADSGEISRGGSILNFATPRDARKNGVDIVQQHFMLVPAFSVAENLALTSMERGSLLDLPKLSGRARAIAEELGWNIDLHVTTSSLSVGQLQRVEIIKALAGDGNVILFDEPTATLSPSEIQDLFRVFVKLKAEGKAIVLITHKLVEALSVADRLTVLRGGKKIVSVDATGVSPSQLAHWMVGDVPPNLSKPQQTAGGELLRFENLTVRDSRGSVMVDNVSFSISSGEIVGFGGVAGNGQVELAEAVAGIRGVAPHRSTGYIPEDRQRDGLALSMSVADNLLINGIAKSNLSFFGFFLLSRIRAWCETIVAKFEIKLDSIRSLAHSLSGGNQQKVVVGRTIDLSPDVIVAVNPTRGLDVRAEHYVHSQLLEAKRRGAGIALFSTDLDELAALADRTYFMSRGKLLEGENAANLLGGVS
jgi:simple sugar transport system ATP-binding protein